MNSNPNVGRFDESDMTPLDDPRLTAYALGELDDAERVEVETLLAGSAEARAAVAEIQLLSGAFVAGFQAEPALTLSVAQREAVSAAVGTWEGGKVGTTFGMAAESVAPVSNRCEAQRVENPLTQPLVENQCHKLQVSEQPLVENQCHKDGGSSATRLVTLKHPLAWFAVKATVGVAASVLLVGALTWQLRPRATQFVESGLEGFNSSFAGDQSRGSGVARDLDGDGISDVIIASRFEPANTAPSADPAAQVMRLRNLGIADAKKQKDDFQRKGGGQAAASVPSESAGVAVAQAALPSADAKNIPDARLLPHFRYADNPPATPQVGQPVAGVGEAGRGFARGVPAPGAAVIGGGGCFRFYFSNPGSSAGLTDSSLALKNTDGDDTDGATYALTDGPFVAAPATDAQAGKWLYLWSAFESESAGKQIEGANLGIEESVTENSQEREEIAGRTLVREQLIQQQQNEKVRGLFDNAAKLRAEGRFAESTEELRKVLSIDPASAKGRYQLELALDYAAYLHEPEVSAKLESHIGQSFNKANEALINWDYEVLYPSNWRETRPGEDTIGSLYNNSLYGGFNGLSSEDASDVGWVVPWTADDAGYDSLMLAAPDRERIFLGRELQLLGEPTNTTRFAEIVENEFNLVGREPLSTFSIDVDTAAYSIVRRNLTSGQLPPPDAVRVEELLNYFDYDYEAPAADDDQPFAADVEFAACPWNAAHRLVRVGLKGRVMDTAERPESNLVFLVDVSGSMNEPNKLPLVQQGLRMLVEQLDERDHVAMVVYAGNAGLVLDSTPAGDQAAILAAIDRLQSGGSTHGSAGITQAYEVATANFVAGGVNRVILCTDGDFNVGVTSHDELIKLIEDKARSGVFLSVLGFGYDNLNDKTLEQLADKGNGNYAYIDTLNEARKVLVDQLTGTLVTIAKDVKIQIEFNPAVVAAYRLIGYENRVLAAQDFNDDTKDAGEIGAGHSVTALYEVLPADPAADIVFPPPPVDPMIDPLKYQTPMQLARVATQSADCLEALTLKLRYKAPDGDMSQLVEYEAYDDHAGFDEASDDFRFAAAVAGFGMQLRGSEHRGDWTLADVAAVAGDAVAADPFGYRAEFIGLVKQAEELSRQPGQQR